jgi:hypothetical protein
MRCGQGDATDDDVLTVYCTGQGLSIQIADKGHRGRQHVITVPYEVLDGIAEQRHEIKRMEQQIGALGQVLADIGRITGGAGYTIKPEEPEEAA